MPGPLLKSRPLLLLLLGGLAARMVFLLLEPATAPVADERTWTNWAVEGLVTPRVRFSPFRIHMIFYPPLYPYFIAAGYALFGTLAAVKAVQALVACLLIPAVGRVGELAFDRPTGLAAAAWAAFYPELIWFSVHFWAETLFMVLLWWGFERLLSAGASGRRGPAIAAGALWGLASLTRETALYFVPAAALWLAWRRRDRGVAAAAYTAAALLTVAPWTYRNWAVFGAFVPVSTSGGLNLYQGNAPLTRQEVYDRVEAVSGRIEQYRFARRAGLEAIRQRQPWWLFEKLRDEMPNYWEADSQALVHVKRKAYGAVDPAVAAAAAVVVLAPYLLGLALFAAGTASVPFAPGPLLLLGFLAYNNLIHVVTHGYARYRLPSMPVVFVVAAWAWTAWRRGRYQAEGIPRRALAVVVAVALGVSLGPSLKIQAEHPAFRELDPPVPARISQNGRSVGAAAELPSGS